MARPARDKSVPDVWHQDGKKKVVLKMKIKILKSFNYGSVSDPQRLHAGNTQEAEIPKEPGND